MKEANSSSNSNKNIDSRTGSTKYSQQKGIKRKKQGKTETTLERNTEGNIEDI